MTNLQNDQPQDQPEKKKRASKARGRSRGEGSVFERKSDSVRRKKPWVAQITVDGKLKTVGYFKTEAEAISARNKALRDREQGSWVESSRQTLAEYLNYWLEHVHKPSLKLTTYRNYRSALDSRIIPALGHLQVQKLTVRHIQMFYSDLQGKEGLSAHRVHYLHAVLHGAMEHAVREGLVARNACHGVRLPRLGNQERHVLSMEQAAQLWNATQNSEMRMLLILAVTTGMREGEMLALKWQDVDLQARQIQVRRNLVFLKGRGLVEMEPKTTHSKRKVPLPSFVVDALGEHQVKQQEARQQAGEPWKNLDLVFCNRIGGYILPEKLEIRFKKLLEDANLPKMRFHDLRHSAVTILLKMGVPPHVVQKIVGHSTINITLGVYGHVLPGQEESAMGIWDDMMKDS